MGAASDAGSRPSTAQRVSSSNFYKPDMKIKKKQNTSTLDKMSKKEDLPDSVKMALAQFQDIKNDMADIDSDSDDYGDEMLAIEYIKSDYEEKIRQITNNRAKVTKEVGKFMNEVE